MAEGVEPTQPAATPAAATEPAAEPPETPPPELTLIAVHGNGGGEARFERVAAYIPSTINFRGVTLPGFADVPRDPALTTLYDYATCLKDLIADEPRPLVLLGHGIGGAIVLEYTQHYTQMLEGIILHSPLGTRLDDRLLPKLAHLPGARTTIQKLFASHLLRPMWRRIWFSHPVPSDYLNRFFDEYGTCSVFAQMFDLITQQWFEQLQPREIPAVLLWGEKERTLKTDQAHHYQRFLPRTMTRIVSNWDHFPMVEQPADYAYEIVRLARKLLYETSLFNREKLASQPKPVLPLPPVSPDTLVALPPPANGSEQQTEG